MTLRFDRRFRSLRTARSYAAVAAALRGLLRRGDFLVTRFSLQGTHLHLVAEADNADALGRAMRALSTSLTRRLTAVTGSRGRALDDRYHARVLSTPTEVRRAVAYVVGNYASHARRQGEYVPADFVDPYSSAATICPDGLPPPVGAPRTWLLSEAALARARGAPGVVSEAVLAYAA